MMLEDGEWLMERQIAMCNKGCCVEEGGDWTAT